MGRTRGIQGTSLTAGVDGLVAWAEGTGRRRAGEAVRGGLRFVFYGRVSADLLSSPADGR